MSPLQPPPPSDPAVTEEIDRFPDHLVLHNLNHVSSDIKSLSRCSAVSRRLCRLVPLVHSLLIHVDCIFMYKHYTYFPPRTAPPFTSPLLYLSHHDLISSDIRSLVSELLLHLNHPLGFNPFPSLPTASDRAPFFSPLSSTSAVPRAPVEVIKNFSDLRTLRIIFPSGELRLSESSSSASASSSTLLRWRAHFGDSLNRCLILATS